MDFAKYADDVVVRIDLQSNEELRRYLNAKGDIRFEKWNRNAAKNTVDIQINIDNLQKLREQFEFNYEVVIEDLAQAVYENIPKEPEFSVMSDDIHVNSELFFKDYRTLDGIYAWLDLLQQSYPAFVNVETIGETYEHRPYKVVHVSTLSEDHSNKKTVVVTAGVHAREWISTSTSLYVLYEMLKYYDENPDLHSILNNLDFLFIPVLNPDGYVYTWETDRLWRKNRQGSDKGCVGIDIDHSYDYHWTESSDDICGEEFSGTRPFEAYEARIWDEYLNNTNHNHKIWGYLDLHSYAQEILTPYAYSCEQTPRDEENLIELAYGLSKAIRTSSGKYYSVLPACLDRDSDLLPDLGAGTALDYMYHNKAYWAYQLKLRDSGSHGFLLPSKYIAPVGEEIFAGIQYFCSFILNDE